MSTATVSQVRQARGGGAVVVVEVAVPDLDPAAYLERVRVAMAEADLTRQQAREVAWQAHQAGHEASEAKRLHGLYDAAKQARESSLQVAAQADADRGAALLAGEDPRPHEVRAHEARAEAGRYDERLALLRPAVDGAAAAARAAWERAEQALAARLQAEADARLQEAQAALAAAVLAADPGQEFALGQGPAVVMAIDREQQEARLQWERQEAYRQARTASGPAPMEHVLQAEREKRARRERLARDPMEQLKNLDGPLSRELTGRSAAPAEAPGQSLVDLVNGG